MIFNVSSNLPRFKHTVKRKCRSACYSRIPYIHICFHPETWNFNKCWILHASIEFPSLTTHCYVNRGVCIAKSVYIYKLRHFASTPECSAKTSDVDGIFISVAFERVENEIARCLGYDDYYPSKRGNEFWHGNFYPYIWRSMEWYE